MVTADVGGDAGIRSFSFIFEELPSHSLDM